MSLLDRVRHCQHFDPSGFRPFRITGRQVGWVRHQFASLLDPFRDVFRITENVVELVPDLDGFDERSAAVAGVLRRLREGGHIRGWRDEDYPVGTSFHAPSLLKMERAAIPAFGVSAYGVHLNGFVGRSRGLEMWVGRRSLTKPTAPGKLDHLVAGGLPLGISPLDNLVKECAEEAAMPASLARLARPVGAVAYRMENEEGLRNDVLFNYDLELPAGFEPRNTDGEIDEFFRWPVDRVIRVLAETEDFKFNVSLVIVDFLIRHGYVTPDDTDYLDIVAGLHGQRSL